MSAYSHDLPKTVGEALEQAVRLLSKRSDLVEQGLVSVEAELIVSSSLRMELGRQPSRSELLSGLHLPIESKVAEKILWISTARAQGRILQHLTGVQTFLEHDYHVSPLVLVPRPETECLVTELVLELKLKKEAPSFGLEVGLGSGIISIELLSRYPFLKMISTEISNEAIELAKKNAAEILGSDWKSRLEIAMPKSSDEVFPDHLKTLGQKFDFIISNPPYLAGPSEVTDEVAKHEPALALYAPSKDILHFYQAMAQEGGDYLNPGGLIAVEIPHERSQAIAQVFLSQGWKAVVHKDLNERDRVVIASR